MEYFDKARWQRRLFKSPGKKRWIGKLKELYDRHEVLVDEMQKRGYNHNSPLDTKFAIGKGTQKVYLINENEK